MKDKKIIDDDILVKKKNNKKKNTKNKREEYKKEKYKEKVKEEKKYKKKENKIKKQENKKEKKEKKEIKKENKEIKNKEIKNKEIKHSKLGMILSFSLVGVIAIILFVYATFYNVIRLNSGNDIVINIYDKYVEPGYNASILGHELINRVNTKSNLNVDKFGDYKITYSLKLFGINFKKVRNIKVSDIESPVINLVGESLVHVCKGSVYSEDGFTANDNYDGELTKKVKTEVYTDSIIYKVKDKNDNEFYTIRSIDYNDVESPKITLNGGDTVYLYVGRQYYENGYTAIDNCDGDITKDVVVENNIDSSKVGEYEVIYKVTDSSGNSSEVKRKAVVKRGGAGVIYLTFDDGPHEGTTNGILDILKKYGIKATFFVTGNGPDYLIQREHNEGHTVALHSASHNYARIYANETAFFNDLYSIQSRVARLTGVTSNIMRFPGGSSNQVSRAYNKGIMTRLSREVQNRGFRYFDWNVSSGDAGGTTSPNGVYSNVTSTLVRGRNNVVLMHDVYDYTMNGLERIIQYGIEHDFEFKPITSDTPVVHHNIAN